MGYACPVCEEPQADAGHLANHLAFTALTGGDDHEDWLDEHVPEWGEFGEDELAAEVIELADETEFPFEADGHDHQHEHDHGHEVDPQQARQRATGELDDEAESILREAREMTESMHDEDDTSDADETE
ncbi:MULTISPECIES: DUF5810 domain-containing protein [Halomicrobium]|uniref:Uncharacterized protein n=2 Tax=Halomicrobium mukohataei TaxID=57705 RepID=C7NZ46_HALMD|nr:MULTISPECIES: DUF5810 domain-containing protein [Halomicrobium]ACV46732.1 conserved hypothetical protein [Halomicrobium mukohataei DSM 12286]QCD65241.1 hypothetical protein E5139_06155 [Halomicrobium mukohataei]QFR20047.1 hypothetical protein GBQ70_06150 [Halomicrobium sp. ZPS1]